MKLFSASKARLHQRREIPVKSTGSTFHSADPHPCQLKCKVKGPDGNQVALVPICLPLSIMASYAVKAAGGSDEVACLASVAVVAQGNAIVSKMKTETLMTKGDVLSYVDTVARNTHHTIMTTVGDRHIADEVEAMIRGGGQLILKSNEERNTCRESRDDCENDAGDGEDVQSIATSVLNNFDQYMMGSSPYGTRSDYVTNDIVAQNRSKIRSKSDSRFQNSFTSPTMSFSTASSEKQRMEDLHIKSSWFGSTTGAADTKEKAYTVNKMNSLDNILQTQSELQQSRHEAAIPYDTTCDTSNNANEYETTSTFNLDTFHPVPSTFYQAIPHNFLGCPNLSMEPVTDNIASLAPQSSQKDILAEVDRSGYIINSGRGIFAVSSHIGVNTNPKVPSGRDLQNNINHPYSNNTDPSVSTRGIQSQMKHRIYTFNNLPYPSPEEDRALHLQSCPIDQESTNSPYTYQSYIEPGKEVDDITFLNVQKEKISMIGRVRRLFVKMNCKSR